MSYKVICPSCSNHMVIRRGALGEFYGCIKYPDCTTTVSIEDIDRDTNSILNTHEGESYGICIRCGEKDTLSENRYCNYCQHMWDKDK